MKVARRDGPEGVVYEIDGSVDSNTSPDLSVAVMPALVSGGEGVALDFRRVTYVSSAGLRVMLVIARKAHACGLHLVLFGLSNPVREVFEISGFTRLLSIVRTEAEALGQLRGPDGAAKP